MNCAKRLVLVGAKEGKRTQYFLAAAKALGLSVSLFTYEEYLHNSQPGDAIKLDPPPFSQSSFSALAPFIRSYSIQLNRLAALKEVAFLNTPDAVFGVLDKKQAKQTLLEHHIPSPEAFFEETPDFEGLLDLMRRRGVGRVFIKPRYGSGAAGVMAFSYQKKTGRCALYTSLRHENGHFINTKTLARYGTWHEAAVLLNYCLKQDTVIERWIPKDQANGVSYDLRVVWLLGEPVFLVPRGSTGPVTNLHLNNMALELCDLPLSAPLLQEVYALCKQAVACFPGLQCAGIDILITPPARDGQRHAQVIELNGQGDLIYKDIFSKNTIYRRQAAYLAGERM